MSGWTVLAASSMEAMVRKIRGVLHMRERQPRPRHHSGRLHQDAENLGGNWNFRTYSDDYNYLGFLEDFP